ncbi:hypothetical protein ABPG74_003493 [Tetrahymena malaccensis]
MKKHGEFINNTNLQIIKKTPELSQNGDKEKILEQTSSSQIVEKEEELKCFEEKQNNDQKRSQFQSIQEKCESQNLTIDQDLQDLGKAIKLAKNVRYWELDLSYNNKLDNIGHKLLKDLSNLNQLEKLSVSLNNTSQNSQCALFAAKCVQLDLSDNCLEDDNLKELVQYLQNLPSLKNVKLNLSKNQFGKSAILLANLLKQKEIKGSLDLRYCKIDQNIIIEISNKLIMQLYLTQK